MTHGSRIILSLAFVTASTSAVAQMPPGNMPSTQAPGIQRQGQLPAVPVPIGAPGIVPTLGTPGLSAPVDIFTGDPLSWGIGKVIPSGCGRAVGAIGSGLGLSAMISDGLAEVSCTTAISKCQSGAGWGQQDAMGKIIRALAADIVACPARAGAARVLIGEANRIKSQANGLSANAIGWAGAHGTYQIPYFGSVPAIFDSRAQANYDRVRGVCDSISSFSSGLKSLNKMPCTLPASFAPPPQASQTADLPTMTADQISSAPGGVGPTESYRIPDSLTTGLPTFEGKPYVPRPGDPLRGTCGGGVYSCVHPFRCKTQSDGSGRCDL